MQGMRKRRCVQGMKVWECARVLHEARESAHVYVQMLKTVARGCIQSLGGVSVTDSEGLWPQLVRCAPHLSTVPLISDKVQ
jgi:hypothetical protein